MDYGMLKILSLQSTSDQTDYIYNSYIASNVASAVTPEQAGMWVYPYEDDREHIIYNMVNGLLLRPYVSGMVWKMSRENLELMREGIDLYKQIRGEIKEAEPFFPLGFANVKDSVLAYGLKGEHNIYLAVFTPHAEKAEIPLDFADNVESVHVIYPKEENCRYSLENGMLKVDMPRKTCGRLFKFVLK